MVYLRAGEALVLTDPEKSTWLFPARMPPREPARSGKPSKLTIEAQGPKFSRAGNSQDAANRLDIGRSEFGEGGGRHALLEAWLKDEAFPEVVVLRPIGLRIIAVQDDRLSC